jgi:hypothetical protein
MNLMINDPINPPPELVQRWYREADNQLAPYYVYIAAQAAQWGADQELESCCEWFVRDWTDIETANKLRADRRPKPPSLKEQALAELAATERCHPADYSTIRRALEALPND